MAYFPPAVPGPEPTIEDAVFWSHCAKSELRFQKCASCGRFRHPPSPICRYCRATEHDWVEARDEAELFSFTVVNYPSFSGIEPALPYNVAIVRFPSFDNVRLVSNIVGAEPRELLIGSRLSLIWEDIGPGPKLPRFRASA